MMVSIKEIIFLEAVFLCVWGYSDSKSTRLRIIGGTTVHIRDYPYQISVQHFDHHRCGGAIISEKYIITAAHCTYMTDISSVNVRVGTFTRDAGGNVLYLKAIHQHPKYIDNGLYDFDISLLELEKPLVFGETVKSVRLPSSNEKLEPRMIANITGWGRTESHDNYSRYLKSAEVDVLSRDECVRAYIGQITDNMFCAGTPGGGRDACNGDSGGPLVANNVLFGIVSWGPPLCGSAEFPGVYSSILSLTPFIDEIVKEGRYKKQKDEL